MCGFVPCSAPRLFRRLLENVFGTLSFPAKSGKLENSMEYDTKASRGTPALTGALPDTAMVASYGGGPVVGIERATPANASHVEPWFDGRAAIVKDVAEVDALLFKLTTPSYLYRGDCLLSALLVAR